MRETMFMISETILRSIIILFYDIRINLQSKEHHTRQLTYE